MVTVSLLDVNILVASVDQEHVAHSRVQAWLRASAGKPWATCPITQAGFVRVISRPDFHDRGVSVQNACELLASLTHRPGHRFWPMESDFLETVEPVRARLFGHRQVTDAYLLCLAIRNKGHFVTLDRAIAAMAGSEFGRYITVLG